MKLLQRSTSARPNAGGVARAAQFAAVHFPHCEVCRAEAAGVHAALEALVGRALYNLDIDIGVREILWPVLQDLSLSGGTSQMDSLDVVEFIMAVEEERGAATDRKEIAPLLEDVMSNRVFGKLLGPFAAASTWDPKTVWPRSVRGVINERSLRRGGCCCPVQDAG